MPPDEVRFAPPDVMESPQPSVRPVPLTRTRPVQVVALFPVTARMSPVVTMVPVELTTVLWPLVCPLVVVKLAVPVVSEFAMRAWTLVPVKTPVFVTENAVAVVELDVMLPSATTAEPPMVVVDGSTTVASSVIVTSLLVIIPPNLTHGMLFSSRFPDELVVAIIPF